MNESLIIEGEVKRVAPLSWRRTVCIWIEPDGGGVALPVVADVRVVPMLRVGSWISVEVAPSKGLPVVTSGVILEHL